jgi:ATP-dependent helicase/nuclease subunit B
MDWEVQLMGFTLVLGRAGSGKTQHCLDEIRERLLAAPEGHPLLLILPEHATFQVERELASTPGIGGFARAYVFGFRRLAQRVLLETGGAVRPHITELGKRLVLSRLLREHQQELKLFHRAAGQRTFAEPLAGMIQEFKTYNVSSHKLAEVQSQLGASPLADKMHDLALLYHDFAEFLQGRYTDPEDYLSLLAAKISHSVLLQGAEVWIDGFSWFNPQEAAVLEQMLRFAANVTVTLCIADADAPEHQVETALFHRQWNTRRKLSEMAQSLSIAVQEQELSERGRFVDMPLLGHIERQFFSFPVTAWSGGQEGIALVEAANRRVEVEGIARDIIRLCQEKGYRWRDMAILLREPDSYNDIVETVLTDYDIPFFSDRKRQPVHHPLAELLRSALETVLERWRYDPVFRCFKTDLFSLSRGEIDELENYVLEFGIRGTRWTSSEPWTFVRRLSLGEDSEIDEARQVYLNHINDIRFKASEPLVAFERQIKQAADVAGMTTALYTLLAVLDVPEKLEKWAFRAEQSGDLEQAREHRQLWDSVVELFEQMVETCGTQELSLADYAAILQDGLEGLKLSLIPPGLDYVAISPLEQTSVANIRAIYVPGINDGSLPMRGRDEGIINDAERLRMAGLGLELAPGAAANSFAERFLIYTALTRASHYLWASYPLADEEGKGLSASLVMKRLSELTQVPLRSLPLEPAAGTEKDYLAHPRRSISALTAAFRLYKNGQVIHPVWWDVYNWACRQEELTGHLGQALAGLFHHNQTETIPGILAGRLYPRNNRLRGSVTRFESFRACPFQHFAQYGLSLKERAIFRLKAPDWGQFLHAALKSFGDRMAADKREWGSISDGEYTEICDGIVSELAPKLQNEILLSSEQYKHLAVRLKRTVERSVRRLVEFDRVSRFKPLLLEKSFGQGTNSLPALQYQLSDGTALELIGQIDRLDVAEHNGRKYFVVIDYKSGGAQLRLVDVYHGLKLQLLTYLLVARQAVPKLLSEAECYPAGMLYYFLKNPSVSGAVHLGVEEITKKINNLLKMPGWTLADPDVARLLDSELDNRSEFLKIALKKDDTFYSNCLTYLKTPEEFDTLLTYVEQVIRETAGQIVTGQIAISPYMLEQYTPCGYCRYRAVCQFDQLLPENKYRKLPRPADEIMMGQLTNDKGGEPK